jgi:hypothetical protein
MTAAYAQDDRPLPPTDAPALGASRSAMAMVQVENVLDIEAQPNLPGTVDGYPELAPASAGWGRWLLARPRR